jgi:hypothetical protein
LSKTIKDVKETIQSTTENIIEKVENRRNSSEINKAHNNSKLNNSSTEFNKNQ